MRCVVFAAGVFALAAVGFAQSPPTVLPQPIVPAGGVAPVPPSSGEAPITRFEPLAAYPGITQKAIQSAVLGGNWLTRMNQAQGRFLFGYRPALRQPLEGDHDLKQVRAALALAQAAKFTGDERQTAVAAQAVLALLTLTKADPADATCRVPVQSSRTCNRVGFAAVLALAIYELPRPDEKLLAEAERLCEFLHRHLQADGSVRYTADTPTDPAEPDPAGVNEYPGAALHAIAVSNRVKPASWKVESLKKGMDHYRAHFKAKLHPQLAASLTPAFTELYLQTKSDAAVAAVFEFNDGLLGLQYAADPRHPAWVGGFKGWATERPAETEPGYECGAYVQSLACAYHLTRLNPDLARAARYRQGVFEAVQFLSGLQYTEANTRHFENAYRVNVLLGGFYLTPTDGTLRIDATAGAVTGLLRFLTSGAEK